MTSKYHLVKEKIQKDKEVNLHFKEVKIYEIEDEN